MKYGDEILDKHDKNKGKNSKTSRFRQEYDYHIKSLADRAVNGIRDI